MWSDALALPVLSSSDRACFKYCTINGQSVIDVLNSLDTVDLHYSC